MNENPAVIVLIIVCFTSLLIFAPHTKTCTEPKTTSRARIKIRNEMTVEGNNATRSSSFAEHKHTAAMANFAKGGCAKPYRQMKVSDFHLALTQS